jgi:hypothetical protein
MSTVQVAGIAIAAVILIVLVISLVITRRKDSGPKQTRQPEQPLAENAGSLFDEAPRDGLHMLGKRDVAAPPEEPQPQWSPAAVAAVAEEAAPVELVAAVEPAPQAPEETTGEIPVVQAAEPFAVTAALDAAAETAPGAEAVAPIAETEMAPSEAAGETVPIAEADARVAEPVAAIAEETNPATSSPVAEQPAEDQAEAPPVDEAPSAEDAAAGDAAAAESRMVRLSDIIVTTNEQQVDLADPEVRRMLKDLMQDEIDLAAQYRELGQNIDAVLQLTEAQRICRALGMTSHARLIQEMINELQ